MAVEVLAENTKTISVTFADFPAGSSYAENEKHDLGEGLVIYTTKCLFTTELRIYSSSTYNGYVVSDPLPGAITSISFRMGYKKDILNVFGSTDKENWVLVEEIETTSTSYENYTVDFSATNYTCFKLDVEGENQIRIKSMSVTYVANNSDDDTGDEEIIPISIPTFTPGSSNFSTESLNVSISAAEGCEVYHTVDGTEPSYTNATDFVGTKGNVATIYASESPIVLKAIAVNPTTGKCSDVGSATYTYAPIVNDGTKSKPYTVAEVAAMKSPKSGKWVKGTIYGIILENNESEIVTSNFTSVQNLVIGDGTTYVPVQLPQGDIRDAINLKDHPYLKGKELLIKGNLGEYFIVQGVREPTEYQITYDVPINAYGYASLYLDMPVSIPTGTVAHYCKTDGDVVNLYPISAVIPDSTGVILSSTPNKTCSLTYTTNTNTDEQVIASANQLVGFAKDSVVAVDGNAYYALNAKNGKLGFYIPQTATDATDAAAGFTAKAYKAYLQIPSEQKALMFVIHREGEETSIVPMTHREDDVIFDLQGRAVTHPVSGIYIIDGKKVVIRQKR